MTNATVIKTRRRLQRRRRPAGGLDLTSLAGAVCFASRCTVGGVWIASILIGLLAGVVWSSSGLPAGLLLVPSGCKKSAADRLTQPSFALVALQGTSW